MSFFKTLSSRLKDRGKERGPSISSDPSRPSEFFYHPLDRSNREIRVLRVGPWNAAAREFVPRRHLMDSLHVVLTTVSLNDKPSYCPVSYAWSQEKPMREVYVDAVNKYTIKAQDKRLPPTHLWGRQKLLIPEDVYSFLKFAVDEHNSPERRNPNVPVGSVWVDQLCINQKDLEERASQVGLMSEIYFRHTSAIVWLGFPTTDDGGDDAELAIQFVDRTDWDFFDRLTKQAALPPSQWPLRPWLPPEHGIIEDPLNPRYWRALRALLLRRWWSRTWIIQESLLTTTLGSVTCGRAQTTMYKFAILYSRFLEAHKNYHIMPSYVRHVFRGIPFTEFLARFMSITQVFEEKRNLGNGEVSSEHSMLPLLALSSAAGVTSPQDRVYALLGLCAKRYQQNIRVDYEMPVPSALLQSFMYIIRTAGLGALQLGKLVKGENMGLPSWMPDLGTTMSSGQWFLEFSDRYYIGQSMIPHPWTADGHTSDWTAFGLPEWTLPSADDSPSNVCAKFSKDHRTVACRGITFDTIAKITTAAPFTPQEIEYCMNSLQDLPVDEIRVQRLADLEALAMAYDADPYPNKSAAFWRTMFLNRGQNKRRLVPYKATEKYRPTDEQGWKLLVQRVAMNLNQRTFFVTTNGYFGIGPPGPREGDLVCVIQTARVPFIFRPTSGREYQFVGDSYVHGICEGEIFDWAKSNGKVIEEFWLR